MEEVKSIGMYFIKKDQRLTILYWWLVSIWWNELVFWDNFTIVYRRSKYTPYVNPTHLNYNFSLTDEWDPLHEKKTQAGYTVAEIDQLTDRIDGQV